jgi:hypothetical protein
MANEELYKVRLKRVQDAVELKESDQVPVIVRVSGLPYRLYGKGSHGAEFYDLEETVEPFVKFYEEFQPDSAGLPFYNSGIANEIAENTMFDWPGRPGSKVSELSTYQIIENEYLKQEEYDELLQDFTGFLFRKWIPRLYPGLKAFEKIECDAANALGVAPLAPMLTPPLLNAYEKLKQIAEANAKVAEVAAKVNQLLTEKGFPPLVTGGGLVPFDLVSDNFRGIMGTFDDLIECPDKLVKAGNMFANYEIAHMQYFKFAPLPVKRVFFPLHKGMDGFMSHEHYRDIYWEPFQQILRALVAMGVTPYIYTEGRYATRYQFIVEQLKEFPPGSCIIHFETGDFAAMKKAFSGLACISGGMSLYTMEYGSREDVVNRVKYLIDNCAVGGGYLFNTGASMENATRENVEALFETLRIYGKK